jgi:translation elongation factor EF-1beta
MGDVILVYKVLPKDPSTFKAVKAGLEKLNPKRLEEEPIGFGVISLKFTALVPDAAGTQEKLEEKMAAIKGIGESELIHFSRSM